MKKYSYWEHFSELRKRLAFVFFLFVLNCILSYIYKTKILSYITKDLKESTIIYTNLTEAFISYIKLSVFCGSCLTFPILLYQIYKFIKPGLYKAEISLIRWIFIFSLILFIFSIFFVFYFVLPKAWNFFLDFENLKFIPKISEYIELLANLIIAFAVAFQLPIVLIILNIMGVINVDTLVNKRRIAILVNFIIAGFITPPDILSQFALAIPMIILYEVVITICKVLNVRFKVDKKKS